MIREYIAAVEDKAKDSGGLTEELKNWILWAQNKTDWYDPFLDHSDLILKGWIKRSLHSKNPTSGFKSYYRTIGLNDDYLFNINHFFLS